MSPAGATPMVPDSAPQPGVERDLERRLDPRYIPLQREVGWIVTGIIGAGLTVALVVTAVSLSAFAGVYAMLAGLWIVLMAGLAWLTHRWPELEYARASYRLDGEGIEIRWGVVWRQVINVPRSRVQHTDVSQGPFERRYGLGTLSIYTAGTDHAKVDLPGLDHGTALWIRDRLLPRDGADAV